MKRLALAAALVAAAGFAAWSQTAGGQTSDVRVNCKSRSIDVYFWPHGHGAVKAYKFTASKPRTMPHLEVYKGGSFASKSLFTTVSAVTYNYTNICVLATNPLGTAWGGGPAKTVTAPRRVRCKFPVFVQIKIIPGLTPGTGYRMVVARGGTAKEVVSSKVRAKGSSLTYDSRYCTATKVPGLS